MIKTFLQTLIGVLALFSTRAAMAADQPQWGQRHSRNMVSEEADLPESFNLEPGGNLKWSAPMGTETYSTPVVAEGCVLIGTNNARPRNERHRGDRGVLLCLDEATGGLRWQLVVPKLGDDPYIDWPGAGISSTATVEEGRVYIVSNRGTVLCLDLAGLGNGNDGPFTDEAVHLLPKDDEFELCEDDADIIWLFDMHREVGIHQHDAAHSSVLIDGDLLYVNTSNGLNSSHSGVFAPDAPSLIVLDKKTGRLAAKDNENIGPRIFHCTWSSPAMGRAGDRDLVFFCGGDGVCYSFEPVTDFGPDVQNLKRVWRFDCDPNSPKENVHEYIRNRKVSPSNIKSMPVFHDGRVYVTVGGDIWWGKHEAWLKCIDAGKSGDVTGSGQLWSYPLERHCCSTPSIWDGLVFVADCGGFIHCVDAESGKAYWKHDAKGEMWASTLVADGKVYAGTKRGDLWVLGAEKEKRVISSVRLDSAIIGSPVAASGTLYIATMESLYAFSN